MQKGSTAPELGGDRSSVHLEEGGFARPAPMQVEVKSLVQARPAWSRPWIYSGLRLPLGLGSAPIAGGAHPVLC